MADVPQFSFGAGELSERINARSDVEKFQMGCRQLENKIPQIYGNAEKRPGTIYIATSRALTATVRVVPFIFSSSIAYEIELGNRYARFLYGGALLTKEGPGTGDVYVTTPYVTAHLFQLKMYQIGDVIWIVHPSYAPRKLSRTDVKTFELTEIDFRKGPFLLRNDLIDPVSPSTITLRCSSTAPGSSGILRATADVFYPGHKGALFKLIHPREDLLIEQNGTGTSNPLSVLGDWNFITRGKWKGRITIQRNQNNEGWDGYRIYTGDKDRNVSLARTEKDENVQYRLIVVEQGPHDKKGEGAHADITTQSTLKEGIVKIDAYISKTKVAATVYSELELTSATKRWSEGAWSAARGYPSAISFLNDRAIFGGASSSLEDADYSHALYPSLRI